MDFEMQYTKEQEQFRQEVSAWLKANIRPEMELPVDPSKQTRVQYDFSRELRVKLGKKGWLAPLYPKEYGGGGLSVEEAVIIFEELDKQGSFLPYDLGVIHVAPACMVWGTEEQKKRFLPPILSGEVISWQAFTEPEAGTDLASLRMRADKDGDDYILNGQKIFIGSDFDVDWLYTLAITDPAKPRHANLGMFIVPSTTPGVTIQTMSMIVGKTKSVIFYDNVRVSRNQLIGGETDGWRVSLSTLEVEHGGSGSPDKKDPFIEQLFEACRQTKRNGVPLSQDPAVRDTLVDVWASGQVERLFGLRNYSMRTSKISWAWEGSQSALYHKLRYPKIAKQILGILGPHALTIDPKWHKAEGEIEYQQRMSIMTHPGGTPEAQKIVMARRIGIAKTKQAMSPMG